MEKNGKHYTQMTRISSKATHGASPRKFGIRRKLLSDVSDDTQLRDELTNALDDGEPQAKSPAIHEAKRARPPKQPTGVEQGNAQGNEGGIEQPEGGNQGSNNQQGGDQSGQPNDQPNDGQGDGNGSNNMENNGNNPPNGNPDGGDNPGGNDGDGDEDPSDDDDENGEDEEEEHEGDGEEEDQPHDSPIRAFEEHEYDLEDDMYDEEDDEDYMPTDSPNLSDYVDTEEPPLTKPSGGEEDSHRGEPLTTWKPPLFSTYTEPSMDIDGDFVANASSGLFNKPRNFRGYGKGNDSAKLWIQRLEYYFKGQRLNPSHWITCAMTFLDGNAFLQMQARKKRLVEESKWDGSWKQFATEFCTLFGAHDEEFAVRTKLTNVFCKKENVLGYLRYFNVLVNKLTKDVPGDDDKIAWFFRGINDSDLYQSLIMDPSTGTRWTSWDRLYHYLLTRYTCVAQHRQTVRRDVSGFKRKRDFMDGQQFGRDERPRYNFRDRGDRGRRGGRFGGNPRGRGRGRGGHKGGDDRRRYHDRFNDRREQNPYQERRNDGDRRNGRDDRFKRKKWDLNTLDVSKLVKGQKLSDKQKEHLKSIGACFNCFNKGHLTKECPNK